jgi:hypothetical protein
VNTKGLQNDLFAARADEAGSPGFEDGVLVGWRTFVVLRDSCDREEGRHAEEGGCESRPSYVKLLALNGLSHSSR